MRTPLAPFERVHFEVATDILCGRCHAPLERHQPDEDRPERLLGTCGGCGTWYLIDLTTSVMIALPVSEFLSEP